MKADVLVPGWMTMSTRAFRAVTAVALVIGTAAPALAQVAPGPPGLPGLPGLPVSAPAPRVSGPVPSVSVAPAGGLAPLGPTGGRVGAGEAAIVAGNVASARERALTEAMKQAVDQAIVSLIPDAHAAQPKLVVQVLGRARGYVRRYRALEEGERGKGLYGVRIEADIDEPALLSAFDKPAVGMVTVGGTPSASPPAYLLVGAGAPDAVEATARALGAAGARVQPARPDLTEPAKAVEAAARAGIATVAFVSGSVASEGKVRGPGLEAVTCSVGVHVLTSGTGLPVANESESMRSFAERSDSARADCFQRAAAAVVPRIVPAAATRVTPDMRTIVLVAAVAQPAAVPALVKQVRAIGSVSSMEIRRITAGTVELWVRSRLPANAFAAALGRDANGALVFSPPEVSGDLVRVTAAFREVATPAPPVAPAGAPAAPGAPSSPAASPASPTHP